jgi:uncharacterized protein YggE
MTVNVEDVNALAQLIDVAAQSGASMITLGSFSEGGSGTLHEQALKDALQGARHEATVLAKEMGRSVGEIVSIEQIEDEAAAPKGRGGEEEEERERAKAKDQPGASTLTEKAQLRVVFQVK